MQTNLKKNKISIIIIKSNPKNEPTKAMETEFKEQRTSSPRLNNNETINAIQTKSHELQRTVINNNQE